MNPTSGEAGTDRQESGAPTADRRHSSHRGLALATTLLLVAALVGAVHGPALRAQALSLDDNEFVTNNPFVSHPGWPSTWRFFREALSPSTIRGYYLPLSMTSLMLDYAMGGRPDDLRVFHRTSLALHVFNTLLIVLLLYRLFGALVPAALAGLLFGLHPLTVEPVVWIAERKTVLAEFFALLSVLAYIRHLRRGDRSWAVLSVAAYLLALLAKPTVMMLPLLLLLLDWWPLKRMGGRAVVEKWPYFVLSLAAGAVTVISNRNTVGVAAADYAHWPLRACYLLGFYLAKIVRPVNLSCVYPTPAPIALTNPVVLVGFVATCAVTAVVVILGRRTRGPLVGWLFFVLAIVPTLGFVQYSWVIASDKYVYFPALGILLVLTAGLAAVWESRRFRSTAARIALLLPLLLVFAAEMRSARAALGNWKDTGTLFRHLERLAPDSPSVQNGFALILDGQSKPDEAIRRLRRAIELGPDFADAQYNLGVLLARQGQFGEATQHLEVASRLQPRDPQAAALLGLSLRMTGRLDEAAAPLRRAVSIRPDYTIAWVTLGDVLMLQHRPAEAAEEFRRAVALTPADPGVHFKLAVALLDLPGQSVEAMGQLRQSIRYKPDWAAPLNTLAWLLATSPDAARRDPLEAVRLAGRAVAATGGRAPEALDTQAAAQAAAGQFDQAVRTARIAIDLAEKFHADGLAKEIRGRLRLYEHHAAYTEPAGAGSQPRS